ncbi:uncharacterized protein LOC133391883 [Anopheles gambiae]|uniref:uncharacterized protein LOC133391883 n=1 Tax=Anopheles gambiae TaxID=7165 RepID=UPI002AC92581|nr:uncharacterized protein LOC133391883 [Anopheles gambiae]
MAKRLRVWALSHKIPHLVLNDLLRLVRETTDIPLPLDSRTLLKTPVAVGKEIHAVAGGEMWYHGIAKCMQSCFRKPTPSVNEILINIFVDGLPLFKSGPKQLWPILVKLVNVPEAPILVVGVFCGLSKPENVEDYLRPLVDELNRLHDDGIVINNKKIKITLKAFLADSPARAFIKGVTYFNGACGCIKCKIVGKFDKSARKMIFEGVAEERIDDDFRDGNYPIRHQKHHTPLLDLKEFNIVVQMSIADDLHLFHLGALKKLLKGYKGDYKGFSAWSAAEQEEINKILARIELPAEIHRGVRSLKYVDYWKGTDFRSFLNHISIPLFLGRIHDSAYDHFKLIYVAHTFLSHSFFKQYWTYAGQLLEKFVLDYSSIYTKYNLTSNVHNLLHVTKDVQNLGPLPEISTYDCENTLQFMKRLARPGPRILNQIVCRLAELRETQVAVRKEEKQYPIFKFRGEEVILFVKEGLMLRKGNRNGWFLTKDREIIRYSAALEESGKVYIIGHLLKKKKVSFSTPCSSDIIFNYEGEIADLSKELGRVPIDSVMCKLVAISLDEGIGYHFSPLLHTLAE